MSPEKKNGVKDFFDHKTLSVYILILLVAFYFRFYNLSLRPVHHDEAVRAVSLTLPLLKGKAWEYNLGFHGPFLMVTTAIAFKLIGVSEFSLRVTEAVFGFLTILLLIPLRAYLGKRGFLFSSALLALSPAFVTYSRMAIQTPLLNFFELASFITVFLYSKTRKPLFAYLAAVSLALGFTVKENMYVFVGLFGPYIAVRIVLSLLKGKRRLRVRFRGLWRCVRVLAVCLLLFSATHLALFSYFGKNPGNIKKAVVTSFTYWQDRVQSRHTKPWSYYVEVLADSEYVLVFFGLFGVAYSIMRRNELGLLLSYWAVSSYVIYSFAIPFKEPWLIPHILLPLIPLSGIIVEGVLTELEKKKKRAALFATYVIVSGALLWYGYVSYDRNFVTYWTESNKLTYVQAYPDVEKLASKIENISYRKTGGKDLDVVYAFDEDYPLRWYLRDYRNVKYLKNPVSELNGWNGTVWAGEGTVSLAYDQTKSGKRSAKISSKTGADASWYQTVKAQERREYVLSGWVKTEGVENINASKVAQAFIRGDKTNKVIGESRKLNGTNNWTYFNVSFKLPSGDKSIKIGLSLGAWGYAKGTVWYDNLNLTSASLTNPDFEEGLNRETHPSVYIISGKDEYTVDPSFKEQYIEEEYKLRPRVRVTAYFRKDLLEN